MNEPFDELKLEIVPWLGWLAIEYVNGPVPLATSEPLYAAPLAVVNDRVWPVGTPLEPVPSVTVIVTGVLTPAPFETVYVNESGNRCNSRLARR